MANAMILKRSISTQTGDEEDFLVYLSNNKTARIYFSSAYKDKVLSFNFGTSKSFIITKLMWRIFRNYINEIDSCMYKK